MKKILTMLTALLMTSSLLAACSDMQTPVVETEKAKPVVTEAKVNESKETKETTVATTATETTVTEATKAAVKETTKATETTAKATEAAKKEVKVETSKKQTAKVVNKTASKTAINKQKETKTATSSTNPYKYTEDKRFMYKVEPTKNETAKPVKKPVVTKPTPTVPAPTKPVVTTPAPTKPTPTVPAPTNPDIKPTEPTQPPVKYDKWYKEYRTVIVEEARVERRVVKEAWDEEVVVPAWDERVVIEEGKTIWRDGYIGYNSKTGFERWYDAEYDWDIFEQHQLDGTITNWSSDKRAFFTPDVVDYIHHEETTKIIHHEAIYEEVAIPAVTKQVIVWVNERTGEVRDTDPYEQP